MCFQKARRGGKLTVDVHVAADICTPERVGDLTGNGVCKEGVVHYDFIGVSRDFFNHMTSFCPPVESDMVGLFIIWDLN